MSTNKSITLKLYPNLHVCTYVPFSSIWTPIRLRTSNIHSAMNMILKWLTFSLKSYQALQDGLVLMSVLTWTVVLARLFGLLFKEQSLSFQAVDKEMGMGTEWLRMCHWGHQWESWESIMGVFTSLSGVLSIIVCYAVCLRRYILIHTAEYFGGNFVS